uniref:Uncharacterized protein n=1 Tax=Anguilla anguilla TaxID=7936 RepID=A0A0E9QDW3_ANGAN
MYCNSAFSLTQGTDTAFANNLKLRRNKSLIPRLAR